MVDWMLQDLFLFFLKVRLDVTFDLVWPVSVLSKLSDSDVLVVYFVPGFISAAWAECH